MRKTLVSVSLLTGLLLMSAGAAAFTLELPSKLYIPPGESGWLAVEVTAENLRSANLTIVAPAGVFESVALVGQFLEPSASIEFSTVDDTIFVAIASEYAKTFYHETLVEFYIEIDAEAPTGILPLVWDVPNTLLNEETGDAITLVDGSLSIMIYGDVTSDRVVSAFDASTLLQYNVRLITEIDETVADVSGSGSITAFDASLILHHVANPGFVFPVLEGKVDREASGAPRVLGWVRDGAGWALTVDDPTGIASGEFTLTLASDALVSAGNGGLMASRQDGDVLHVAFIHTGGTILFRIEGNAPCQIVGGLLNEGTIPPAGLRPPSFGLDQNVPNPFNPMTTIRFTVVERAPVTLAVYLPTGQLVRTLVSGSVEPGAHEIAWDGRDSRGAEVSSGVYLYRLTNGSQSVVRRMILVR